MSVEQLRNPGDIPSGITFGNKVAILPLTPGIFDRAIWIQACLSNNPKVLYKPYTWINRGENLMEFTILTPKTGIPLIDLLANRVYNKIYLKSPVSGLILNSRHDFSSMMDDSSAIYTSTSILLPDNEPTANNGEYIFGDLCNFCWENRSYIFYKPREFRGHLDDVKLHNIFSKVIQKTCSYSEAMPYFEPYFQEASNRHSQLRPYLKHLL